MFTTFNIFIIWHIHVVVFSDISHDIRNLVHIAAAPDNNGVHKLCCLRNLWIYKSYCSCKVQFFACLLFWNLYIYWKSTQIQIQHQDSVFYFLHNLRPEKSRKRRIAVPGKFYGHHLIEEQNERPNLIPTRIISESQPRDPRRKLAPPSGNVRNNLIQKHLNNQYIH